MNIKIMVAYHKQHPIHEYINNKEIYLPIFCGKMFYTGDSQFLLNMQGDNTDENISYLNKNLNEITGLYWFGNHLNQLNNPDFVGLFHYRRFLKYNVNDLSNNKILVNKYDFHGLPVYNQILYAETTPEILNTYLNLYCTIFKEDTQLMNQFLKSTYLYACNMFIMPKQIFKEYFKFLKANIDICKILLNNRSFLFLQKPRMLGMFLERMTGFFIFKKQHEGIKIQSCQIIGEQNK